MKIKLVLLGAFLFVGLMAIGQTCVQPGALVSVNNLSTEKYDYLVFKFIKPHPDKGILSGGNTDLFPAAVRNKNTYHKIVFNNVAFFCYNKINVSTPSKRLLDFRVEQKTDNMVSYVFELAEGAKIRGHYVYRHHGFHIVKIRIE